MIRKEKKAIVFAVDLMIWGCKKRVYMQLNVWEETGREYDMKFNIKKLNEYDYSYNQPNYVSMTQN